MHIVFTVKYSQGKNHFLAPQHPTKGHVGFSSKNCWDSFPVTPSFLWQNFFFEFSVKMSNFFSMNSTVKTFRNFFTAEFIEKKFENF